jgi:Spy/CpxP family protein refolding chaperone
MKIPTKTLTLVICLGLSLGSYFALHAQDSTPRPRGRDGGPGGGFGLRGGGPGFDSLTQEEKDKLRAAMEKAQQDPKVKEARDKAEAAQKEFRDAVQSAAVAADPSVEPILKKLQEAREKAMQERGQRGNGEPPKPNN